MREYQDTDPPKQNEGASVGLLILLIIYFIAGVLIGAWLW